MGAEAQLSYSEIRSPINGVITDRPLYPGEMAAAGTPLLTVMDISSVIAKAHIPQSEAAALKPGDAGTMTVPGIEKPIEGKVTVVSPALDPNSTTVEIWFEARNPKHDLKPGTSVQLALTAQTVNDALVDSAEFRAHRARWRNHRHAGGLGWPRSSESRETRHPQRRRCPGTWKVSAKTTKLYRTAPTAFRTRPKSRSRRPKLPRKEKTGNPLPAMQKQRPGDPMTSNTVGVRENSTTTGPRPYWVAQHSRPVIFLILTLGLLGAYLAFTIPVSVFPQTNFPRVLIGVDNGVMPIDQMMVTITRPLEEAVNSVPGLLTVRSVTSRGSAEVDLYFRWDVDMFQTLQYVNAAISRVQPELPPTAVIRADRLTFAAFPIIAYSVTSDTMPQTRLWEMATYEMKPRLNRLDGVSTVIVQGGQEPEFQIMPDPAKLLAASVTVPDILDAVRRTNLVDSPGLLEQNHQLYLGLVNGQVRTPEQIAHTVIKNTPAGIPVRIGDIAA